MTGQKLQSHASTSALCHVILYLVPDFARAHAHMHSTSTESGTSGTKVTLSLVPALDKERQKPKHTRHHRRLNPLTSCPNRTTQERTLRLFQLALCPARIKHLVQILPPPSALFGVHSLLLCLFIVACGQLVLWQTYFLTYYILLRLLSHTTLLPRNICDA